MRCLCSVFVILTLAGFPPATSGSDGDPVTVVQETRTPATAKKKPGARHAPSIQHVALLKNSGPRPVRSRIEPGATATLSLSTPTLEAARRTRYRMEYGGEHAGQHGRP